MLAHLITITILPFDNIRLNANVWTIGLARSGWSRVSFLVHPAHATTIISPSPSTINQGNEVGLSLEEWYSLSQTEKDNMLERAYQSLLQSGAHYVVEDITRVPEVLDEINERLAQGQRPTDG